MVPTVQLDDGSSQRAFNMPATFEPKLMNAPNKSPYPILEVSLKQPTPSVRRSDIAYIDRAVPRNSFLFPFPFGCNLICQHLVAVTGTVTITVKAIRCIHTYIHTYIHT